MKKPTEMERFIFIMIHPASEEQMAACGDAHIEQVSDKGLLIVPDNPDLEREWFTSRAAEIEKSFAGFGKEDIIQIMGQQQLAMSVSALARKAGATLVESVTPRESVEETLPDGSVKKTNVFRFIGFRTVHRY
jgi:hypothetical protein